MIEPTFERARGHTKKPWGTNMPLLRPIKIAALAVGLAFGASSTAQAASNMLIILDASNSMWGQVGGVAKIQTAKEVLADLLSDLPADTKVGLMAYGHRVKGDCQDVETLSGIGSESPGAVASKVNAITPQGKTPIAYSLQASAANFDGLEAANNNLVLISDGIESCDGDPCAVAAALASKGIGVKVHVVGFDVDTETRAQLECIAENGGGKYFDAGDTATFKQAVAEVQQVAQAAPEPAEPTITEVFRDDFDGEELADHWEVLNPDPDSFIVEDGFLHILTSVELSIYDQSDELPNLFRLTEPLPKGDWTATLRVMPNITTFRERYALALYSDKDSFLVAAADSGVAAHAGNIAVTLYGTKRAKGKDITFSATPVYSKQAFGHRNVSAKIAEYSKWTDSNVRAILLRIRKSGRSYIVSGKIEGDGTEADGIAPQWVELQELTSLRSPGKFLSISVGQRKFDNRDFHLSGGETLANVDWVKIEVPTQ